MALFTLFLSIIFSAWYLLRERRRRPSFGLALWLPTLLLFILASRPVTAWLGIGSGEEGSWPDQLFYLVIILGSLIVASSRGVSWRKLAAANSAIALFYFYFALSSFWSADPSGSFKRWSKLLGIVFAVSVILSEKNPLDAMRAVYARCACVLLPLSLVFIKYFPALGRNYAKGGGEPMVTGVTTQKNSLGEMALVFTFFFVWEYLESRSESGKSLLRRFPWDRAILSIMGVYVLLISQSKTSLVCLVIGLSLILLKRSLASRMISGLALYSAMALPFLLFLTQHFTETFTPILALMGRDATLTGRTGIWQHISLQTVNPLLGDGYFSFWGTSGGEELRAAMADVGVHSAHNGYLDVYLDGGLVGVGFLFFLLMACGVKLSGSIRASVPGNWHQCVRFAFLIVLIIYNLSESTFARLAPTWFTGMLLFIDLKFRSSEALSG